VYFAHKKRILSILWSTCWILVIPALDAAACMLASPVAMMPRIEVAEALPDLEDPEFVVTHRGAEVLL
jgi:hypothetical protein